MTEDQLEQEALGWMAKQLIAALQRLIPGQLRLHEAIEAVEEAAA